MKNLLRVAAATLALLASPAWSQSLMPNCRNVGGSYIPCDPVVLVDKFGIIIDSSNPLPTIPAAAPDATSGTTQQNQLAQEQLTAARLGDATAPANGTVNSRLGALLAALGTPLQAGGSVTARGGSSIATGQVSVGTTATLIVAPRANRQKVMVTLGAANDCFFGPAAVTTTTGFRVKGVDGATATFDTASALYGVCAATTPVSEAELF